MFRALKNGGLNINPMPRENVFLMIRRRPGRLACPRPPAAIIPGQGHYLLHGERQQRRNGADDRQPRIPPHDQTPRPPAGSGYPERN